MPTNKVLATKRSKTQIGIWYSLWYDSLKDNSFWDNEGTGQKIYYRPLLPDGSYGKYDSGDKKVLNFHLEQLTEAGIDFLIYDQTNGLDVRNAAGETWINDNAIEMSKAICAWNKAGNRNIKYCSSIGMIAVLKQDYSMIEAEAKMLWERYNLQEWGNEEHHMYVDGKPLLVLMPALKEHWDAYDGDKTYTNKFTLRFATGYGYGEENQWGWVVPKAFVTDDVTTLMPGWYKKPHFLESIYRHRGTLYKQNWETVLKADIVPNYIVINSFNEYAEHTGVFTADTSDFPEDYPIERWVNEEGLETPSLYWDMTKKYIGKYRNGDRE